MQHYFSASPQKQALARLSPALFPSVMQGISQTLCRAQDITRMSVRRESGFRWGCSNEQLVLPRGLTLLPSRHYHQHGARVTLILLAILAYPLARAVDRYVQRRENAFYLARTRALHNEAVKQEAAE